MRFSVIIPVYNVQEYLCGCIDSVLANDCSSCEILLVDDGSTDGVCPEICDEYAAKYPELIKVIHQENQGLGGARNTGIEHARGEYLLFVDSDDTISQDTLKILNARVDETHADIYSFNLYSHDGQGNQKYVEVSPAYEGAFTLAERPEFMFSLPAAWARLWRRDLFVNTGIRYPSRVWYEDIRTSVKLFATASSIVSLPDALYFYLARPGSIMRSSNVKRSREILDAFDDILQWYGERGLAERYGHEICRLAVDHIQLAAVVRVIRDDPHSPLIAEFTSYMYAKFPSWPDNPYLEKLPRKHKLLLKMIAKKRYCLIGMIFRVAGSQ